MLAQKNEQAKEQPLYYLNHILVDYEIKYIYIKNVYLVVIVLAKEI